MAFEDIKSVLKAAKETNSNIVDGGKKWKLKFEVPASSPVLELPKD